MEQLLIFLQKCHFDATGTTLMLFAGSWLANTLYHAFYNMNIRIPDDVSVLGLYDYHIDQFHPP